MEYFKSLFKSTSNDDKIKCKQLVKDLFDHKITTHLDMDNIRIFCQDELNNHIGRNLTLLNLITLPIIITKD